MPGVQATITLSQRGRVTLHRMTLAAVVIGASLMGVAGVFTLTRLDDPYEQVCTWIGISLVILAMIVASVQVLLPRLMGDATVNIAPADDQDAPSVDPAVVSAVLGSVLAGLRDITTWAGLFLLGVGMILLGSLYGGYEFRGAGIDRTPTVQATGAPATPPE